LTGVFAPVVARYLGDQGGVTTALLVCTLPAGIRLFPKQAAWVLLLLLILSAMTLIPPNSGPPYPLLDRPMLEIALFIPMALLGGAAATGALSALPITIRSSHGSGPDKVLLITLVAIVLAWLVTVPSAGPSQAGLFAGQDDLRAMEIVNHRKDANPLVLVAARARLDSYLSPVDGGGWLPALTEMRALRWPADSDLASPAVHSRLCEERVTMVYVGATPHSFSRTVLDLNPRFFSPLAELPRAAVYELKGCRDFASRQGSFP
jgi:hypothetical protein